VCPTKNNTSGKLKYPDIDVDKTAVLRKQANLLAKNVTKVFKFQFEFERAVQELEIIEAMQRVKDRLSGVMDRGLLNIEEMGKSSKYEYKYKATVKLSIKQALEMLQDYGIKMEYNVHRTYKVKDKDGNEKVVPFTRKPVDADSDTPRGGILTEIKDPRKDNTYDYPHMPSKPVKVKVSHEFDIAEGCLPGWHANREDYLTIRKGLWHEIMETALIAIAVEALYSPMELIDDLDRNPENNFANNAVMRVQRAMYAIGEDRRLFLYWPGDPPFDAFEVSGYTREEEAKRLKEIAIMLEQQGNFSGAANRWEEAENAWERAIEAWQAIPGHPEREKRISAARAKLAEAKERKETALWKSAWWDASKTSRGEVSIRYSSWPDRFKARIVDVGGNVLARFDKPGGTGVVTWGKGAKAGVYFIKVEAERVEPMVRKVVVP
jgi:hypothetical protein